MTTATLMAMATLTATAVREEREDTLATTRATTAMMEATTDMVNLLTVTEAREAREDMATATPTATEARVAREDTLATIRATTAMM